LADKEKILQRLKKIEGQVKGIQKMIEGNRGCEDTLTQMIAARAAMDKTIGLVVESEVESCIGSHSPEDLKADFLRLLDLLLRVR
jgi:DNA-binding FrmR family transcriptional regulator